MNWCLIREILRSIYAHLLRWDECLRQFIPHFLSLYTPFLIISINQLKKNKNDFDDFFVKTFYSTQVLLFSLSLSYFVFYMCI